MTTERGNLDDLRRLRDHRIERRTSEPLAVDDSPSGATVIEATDLLTGMVRWRDASPEARRLARSWGDRPPVGEPEPGR